MMMMMNRLPELSISQQVHDPVDYFPPFLHQSISTHQSFSTLRNMTMKVCSRIPQGFVVLVTATSLLGSQVLVSAAQVSVSAQAVDVALSVTGTLSGAVVDTRGHARGKTAVEVRRGRRLVARALTDANGRYDVSNLPGGLYQVRVDGTETLVRAWAAGTAPRSAAKQLPVIADAPIVRGQDQDAPPADCCRTRLPRSLWRFSPGGWIGQRVDRWRRRGNHPDHRCNRRPPPRRTCASQPLAGCFL